MPLKLLKRTSAQYNVVSKTTFVISVELLDNGTMECTLDADSTGKDCLLNISQRLGLHQPEFFGLRYISRGVPPRQRWVELERPLKKQLEKHAQDSQLSLGVMFYVADVNLLKDEMARYHYFLQLKSDFIEGKLNCNIDQAISLAAYSLQAEFGDYDPERHTIEYLRDFAILPQELAAQLKLSDMSVDTLYESVARQYGSLVGFPPPLAEIYYIMVAQQLDGYGQEAYPAKDDAQNDIMICVGLNGLVIRRRDWTHVAVFRWNDIKSMIAHKRLLVLEKAQSRRTAHFHFTDSEVAKYVRKMCNLQSTFYKTHVCDQANFNESHRPHSLSSSEQTDTSETQPPMVRTASEAAVPVSSCGAAVVASGSHCSLNNNCFGVSHGAASKHQFSNSSMNSALPHSVSASSYSALNSSASSMKTDSRGQFVLSTMENGDVAGRVSNSTAMLTNSRCVGNGPDMMYTVGMMQSRHSMTNTNDDSQRALPSYRPAPDYETAVQLKYGIELNNGVNHSIFFNSPSQPVQDEPIYQNEIVSHMHSIELQESPPPKLTDNQADVVPASTSTIKVQSTVEVGHQEVPVLSLGTSMIAEEPHLYMFKPPPPYPGVKHDLPAVPNVPVIAPQAKPSSNTSTVFISNTTISSETAQIFITAADSVGVPNETTTNAQPHEVFCKAEVPGPVSIPINSTNTYEPESAGTTFLQVLGDTVDSAPKTSVIILGPEPKEETLQLDPVVSVSEKSSPSTTKVATKAGSKKKMQEKPKKDISDLVIAKEFEGIFKSKNNADFATALKIENSKRNRCPNILPYEDNCVRLTQSRANPRGYINASPVAHNINGREWKYIVGQIPLAGSASAVWQMIWETGAKVVAVLERDSSAVFYPPAESGPPMIHSDYQITESKSHIGSSATIARELTLTYIPKRKSRKVWILPYEDEWKDDVPVHTEHFLCFLEEVNAVLRKYSEPSSPLVVLCGTGAGRSGVLILSDLLLHAADAGQKLQSSNLLAALRNQRMMLVSSVSQYVFVLQTLAKYLAQSRLI